ncbi:MAG: ribulose-phosphate 3-epimerase [Bacteroidetes bacterium GWE2_29_8]|nr:MAG: ribulose-phosphate 3-epimerase [Bacteroidetes bacterium GWE2_29_8]OFY22894.1 MAG: ribulose-phosphate 3-epimerase [Bacteroidetes bacterium GWF2_29_10]
MKHLIAPSLLSADFLNLGNQIDLINNSNADLIHLDVMDGVFVPNISYGFPVISAVKRQAKKILDAHLMIVNPDNYIEKFAEVGVEMLSVHYEACTHLHRTIEHIKSLNIKAGVAINPHTSVNLLEDILEDVDFVLIMSVNPGFGGQKFIDRTFKKIEILNKLRHINSYNFEIEVDGGVDFSNYKNLVDSGVDILVAGNTIFKAIDINKAIDRLKFDI